MTLDDPATGDDAPASNSVLDFDQGRSRTVLTVNYEGPNYEETVSYEEPNHEGSRHRT